MYFKDLIDNSNIRRQDRILEADAALALLAQGEYGFLALGGKGAYGVPMNYVLGDRAIYFHCAKEGEKLYRIRQDSRACFCVVGSTAVQADRFTTEYKSVMVKGQLFLIHDESEVKMVIDLILDKYSAGHQSRGLQLAQKSLSRTQFIRLEVTQISAKCKRNRS